MLAWNEKCKCCGSDYRVTSARHSVYCSSACKQKAYRARKNDKATALKNSELDSQVDYLMSKIHDNSKDVYSAQLWSLLDSIPVEQLRLDIVTAIQCALLARKETS